METLTLFSGQINLIRHISKKDNLQILNIY